MRPAPAAEGRRVSSDPRAGRDTVQELRSSADRDTEDRCPLERIAAELRTLQASLWHAENGIQRVLDVLEGAAVVAEAHSHVPLPSDFASPPGQAGPTAGLAATNELVGRLLAVLHGITSATVPGLIYPAPSKHGAVEPLTDREADVLEHLSARLSNKEIAERLCISPHTVKRHTINLYQKLSVQGRRQAVAQARTLGLLP